MASQKKQSLLNGALILSLAIVAVKLIGVFFKLYVTLKIGYDGKGYYATAYNIYTPIYSIALAGFPTAVSKMVASLSAQGKYRDIKATFRVSTLIFTLLGAVGTIAMLLIAFPYTKSISSPDALAAIFAIAPSLFFCCVMSGYRGYYQGMQDMTPSAVSQVLEAAGKLIFGWLLINAVTLYGVGFADSIPVLSKYVTDTSQAYAAAAAIAGVTIGSLMGLVYLMLRHRIKKSELPSELLENAPAAEKSSSLAKQLIIIAIPIAVSSLVSNITTFIDNWTVQNRLQAVLSSNFDTVAAMYPGIVEARGFTAETAAAFKNYLYGAYDTVLEIKNIVPTFTITLGLSAIPVLSAAWVNKDKNLIKKSVDSVVRISMLLALPAGCGMFALAEDILWLLYGRNTINAPAIPYIAPILMLYGISVFFLALMQPVTNMLQAIDRMNVPVIAMAVGSVLKIVANIILVGTPSINIQGAVVGSILCNIAVDVICIVVLIRTTGIRPDWKSLFFKPGFCAVLSGAGAWLVSEFYEKCLPEAGLGGFLSGRNIATICAVFTAVVIYAVAIIVTRTLRREDLEELPGGGRMARLLDRFGLI